MTEPMGDVEFEAELRVRAARLDPKWETVTLYPAEVTGLLAIIDAERSRADAAEAARDAALARAMPAWRYLATWADVAAVEARHNDEPPPGLYLVWKPGWSHASAAEVQFGVEATNAESPACDDYLLGAWIAGPILPDLPIPTPTQEG